MLHEPVTAMMSAGAGGSPMAGFFPVSVSEASLVVLGFLVVTCGALWLIGDHVARRPHDDPPALYREAA
jgi:hypothetical protein